MNTTFIMQAAIEAVARITSMEVGTKFEVMDLFPKNLWMMAPSKYKQELEKIFYTYVNNDKIKGVSIIDIKNDKVIYKKDY